MKKLYIIYILFPFIVFAQKIPPDSLYNRIIQKNSRDSLLILMQSENKTDSIFASYKNIEQKLDRCQKKLIEKGYIFNRLYPVKINETEKLVKIYYQAKLNKLKTIDTLIYISNKFPANLKKHIWRKFQNRIVNNKNIQALENFIQWQYPSSENQIFPAVYNRETALIIKTQSVKKNAFDAFLGLNNTDGKTSIEGKLALKLSNIFNQNESIKFDWQNNSGNSSMRAFAKFPYLAGTHIYLLTDNTIINENNKNLKVNLENSIGYMTNRQSVGLKLNYIHKIYNESKTSIIYYGLSHRFLFKKQYIILRPFDIQNIVKTEMDIIPDKNKNYAFYNEIRYTQKLYTKNFVNFTNFFQSGNQEILQIKNSYNDLIFKTLVIDNNAYRQILLSQLKYMYVLSNYIFYGVARLDYKNTIRIQSDSEISPNKSFESGIGVNFRNKNQILTFEVIYFQNLGVCTDNQYFRINILNKIRF